jgi:flagellar M-ring protein FliF
MKKLLAALSMRQRLAIGAALLLAGAGLYALVRWRREADFRPLFGGLAPEDAAGIVQKLKESGVDYRLSEDGAAVLAPSARIAELRINLAAAGLPRSGRIGFELFDKTNLGTTEFAEQVNYRRALEGELERSVMSLAEVEQARVHISFPKESVFLERQEPAKASVLVRLRPGAVLAPRNVTAIDNLVASAVEGLAPEAVSVVDMNGNLLGKPRPPEGEDGPETSEAALEFQRQVEADLIGKITATLEPVLGAERFRAGASVECDFTGSEQSEEIFDPARSVMVSSQRTEDNNSPASSAGVPGTASSLPNPPDRPVSVAARASRVTEDITYQSSRTVRKTHVPAGAVRKMSLAVLVDQQVDWQKENNTFRRVLVPPSPETLQAVRDLVTGATGLNAERGDQLVVETLPFETTLLTEPPAPPPASPVRPPHPLDRLTLWVSGAAALALLLILTVWSWARRRSGQAVRAALPPSLPAAEGAAAAVAAGPGGRLASGRNAEQEIEAKLAEQEATQKRLDAQALNALKLAPAITKTSEVLARHLRDKIKQEPELPSQILLGWIREEKN